MTNFTDSGAKNVGGLASRVVNASPGIDVFYRDSNGLVRVANSGVVIAGQPELLSGTTIITQNDRGKTG